MFFKPKWYSMLPDYLKPMGDEVINRIKEFQKKSGWTDEIIFAGIMVSQWAVKRIQKACLEQYKKQMPNASEQALWTGVLLSRFHTKLTSLSEIDPFAKPLSKQEIQSRIGDIDNIVSGFKSFDDVLGYIIAMDEAENRFYDPTGTQKELNNLLEGAVPDSSHCNADLTRMKTISQMVFKKRDAISHEIVNLIFDFYEHKEIVRAALKEFSGKEIIRFKLNFLIYASCALTQDVNKLFLDEDNTRKVLDLIYDELERRLEKNSSHEDFVMGDFIRLESELQSCTRKYGISKETRTNLITLFKMLRYERQNDYLHAARTYKYKNPNFSFINVFSRHFTGNENDESEENKSLHFGLLYLFTEFDLESSKFFYELVKRIKGD